MEIVKNKEKLRRWLAAEQRKLAISGILFDNKTINERRAVLKKISEYSNLIRESKRRFNSSNYKPMFNNKFSNNKNWNGNFNGIVNAVPLILVTNNRRYLGHVWVNGKGPNKTNRSTGHFQGIQKTVNLNQNIINVMENKPAPLPPTRVAPTLLKAAEDHLRNLGYGAMSTYFPLGKMFNMLRQSPNWEETGPLVYKKNILLPSNK
jgi:hypothetical protein